MQVATRIQLGDDMKPSGNYSVAFYVPEDFQGKAPAPTSNDVKVVNVKGKTAYVASFGGFATEGKLLEVPPSPLFSPHNTQYTSGYTPFCNTFSPPTTRHAPHPHQTSH